MRVQAIFTAPLLALCFPAMAPAQTAEDQQAPAQPNVPEPVAPLRTAAPGKITLPVDSIIEVTPIAEITSKGMKVGDAAEFRTAADVVQSGVIVVPRGSVVMGKIIWRTGRGIGGKSAKFEVAFSSVSVKGQLYALKGKHRQEGKGNTMAALLGSMLISGRSAVMTSGQIVNAFTAQPISVAS